MKKWLVVWLLASISLAGCSGRGTGALAETASDLLEGLQEVVETVNDTNQTTYPGPEDEEVDQRQGRLGMEPGWMMGSRTMAGMRTRHHASIPAEYAGQRNPLGLDEAVLAAGEALYLANCASCHGETGLGDGPAGAGLDPLPAPLAHSGMMLADDYLYWRIAEGGVEAPFDSAMPAWKAILSEQETWQVVSYLRGLNQEWINQDGSVGRGPGRDMMGSSAWIHEEMLEEAVKRELISEGEAEIFNQVHDALDEGMFGRRSRGFGLGMEAVQDELLAELVEAGTLTQAQVDTFLRVHELLEESGLMP